MSWRNKYALGDIQDMSKVDHFEKHHLDIPRKNYVHIVWFLLVNGKFLKFRIKFLYLRKSD